MGDGLKISKDKRHRSSSSLAALEATRSERRLDKLVTNGSSLQFKKNKNYIFKASRMKDSNSIPEMEDPFDIAEKRCDDLQGKIDLIKSLKRKKKLKKRSTTRIADTPMTLDHVPFITVRTQPKKKVSQQAARLRRLEVPVNPTRGYLDPATVEQHRMIGQVRGYNNSFKQPHQERTGNFQSSADQRPYIKLKRQRSHADGDSMCSQRSHLPSEGQLEVACGQDETGADFSNYYHLNRQTEYSGESAKKPIDVRLLKQITNRRRHVPRDIPNKEERMADQWHGGGPQGEVPVPRRRQVTGAATQFTEERPVVELFNKNRILAANVRRQGNAPMIPAPLNPLPPPPHDKKPKKVRKPQKYESECNDPLENIAQISVEPKHEAVHHPRRIKYRSRRYEMPTVASQMKQAGMRNYYGTSNHTNIPFVVSKSTAPSHNIGVNIQQVLNGLKIQQPLSGIPLTIALHMGLGHVPVYPAKTSLGTHQPSLDHHDEINAIRVGRRVLRLPSYKYISYNRVLNLYREGDGMVPRFLRAIARPHYFYTSMYNLATNREDFDCATSKGRGGSQEAKQSLAEYANLYREYEQINKCIKEGSCEPELERRKEELTKELAAREEHIHRVVQEFRAGAEPNPPLRASMSTAGEGYRHSAFKTGEAPQ